MRTVRSTAAARNQRRPRLAWLLLLILIALIALSARVASGAPARSGDEPAIDELDAEELDELAERAELAELALDPPTDPVFDDDDAREDDGELGRFDRESADDLAREPAGDLDTSGDLEGAADLAQAGDHAAWPAAGGGEPRPVAPPRQRSRLGRIDVSMIWRRVDPIASPRRDEIWLLGAWRL